MIWANISTLQFFPSFITFCLKIHLSKVSPSLITFPTSLVKIYESYTLLKSLYAVIFILYHYEGLFPFPLPFLPSAGV